MQTRPGNQRRQPLHELQRAQDQMRRAVAPRCLQLQLDLPGGIDLHPFVGKRRPGDVAAQLLQPLAVMGFDPHRGVQAESVDVGAQRLAGRVLARLDDRMVGDVVVLSVERAGKSREVRVELQPGI